MRNFTLDELGPRAWKYSASARMAKLFFDFFTQDELKDLELGNVVYLLLNWVNLKNLFY